MLIGPCKDLDNGKTDSLQEDCSYYTEYKEDCGQDDDVDFKANELCCACGGGGMRITFHIQKHFL